LKQSSTTASPPSAVSAALEEDDDVEAVDSLAAPRNQRAVIEILAK
jgi:hypothetical protein